MARLATAIRIFCRVSMHLRFYKRVILLPSANSAFRVFTNALNVFTTWLVAPNPYINIRVRGQFVFLFRQLSSRTLGNVFGSINIITDIGTITVARRKWEYSNGWGSTHVQNTRGPVEAMCQGRTTTTGTWHFSLGFAALGPVLRALYGTPIRHFLGLFGRSYTGSRSIASSL